MKQKRTTCHRLEPRGMVQKGLLEIVGRSDSDWAGDSATRQSVTGYHCNVQNVTMCNRSLKQTAISLSSCEAESYAASACAGELAELLKELHYDVSVRLEMDSPGGLKQNRNTMLDNTTVDTREMSICEWSGHEEQHCRSLHETSGWIANAVARKETWTSNHGCYEWFTAESF